MRSEGASSVVLDKVREILKPEEGQGTIPTAKDRMRTIKCLEHDIEHYKQMSHDDCKAVRRLAKRVLGDTATITRIAKKVVCLEDELMAIAAMPTRTRDDEKNIAAYHALCGWWDKVEAIVLPNGEPGTGDDDQILDEIQEMADLLKADGLR